MDLNEVRVFAQVARLGSFTAAAKHLGMPISTVSAKVTALEKRLQASLLKRTTRKLHLTEAGERYFERCAKALVEIETADRELRAAHAEPQGLLRITAPDDMGSTCLVELAKAFGARFPKVQLDFLFTDRFVDLVGEGVDLGIRAGELGDSSLHVRKLGVGYWAAFASPAYLKRAGIPRQPHELASHDCVMFTPMSAESWVFNRGRASVSVRISRKVLANDLSFIKALAAAGKGIALLPTFSAEGEVHSGRLVRLLPEWRSNSDPIHVVYPAQKFVPPKTRVMVEELVATFKELLEV